MITDSDKQKMIEEYKNREFSIIIFKAKGEKNTKQIYNGNKAELGTCIASMVEQLIKNKIFSPEEMLFTINMAIEKLKKDLK